MFPLDVSTASPVPLLLFVAALPVVARPKKQRTLNCFNQDQLWLHPWKFTWLAWKTTILMKMYLCISYMLKPLAAQCQLFKNSFLFGSQENHHGRISLDVLLSFYPSETFSPRVSDLKFNPAVWSADVGCSIDSLLIFPMNYTPEN